MSRLETIQPSQATGRAKELLDDVKSKLGMAPNMMRAMANSPSVLAAYLQFSGALGEGVLPARTREQIALTVGQQNSCDYCLSAHSAIGKMVGLAPEQILAARRGESEEAKTNAILKFTSALVEKRGLVSDSDVNAMRDVGVSDGEISEIVANTALNLFTNYFNHVSQVDVDFPAAAPLPATANECSVCHA